MKDAVPVPAASAKVERLFIKPNGGVPNHPRLPALLYPGAVDRDAGLEAVKALCVSNGWSGLWDWTVFDFHHFHPASHEALIVVAGHATLDLGGPDGATREVTAGDALILPAGFGHRRAEGSGDFRVVGAYPKGQESPEVLRADVEAAKAVKTSIAATPIPNRDPVFGRDGPLIAVWGAA